MGEARIGTWLRRLFPAKPLPPPYRAKCRDSAAALIACSDEIYARGIHFHQIAYTCMRDAFKREAEAMAQGIEDRINGKAER